MHTGSPLRPGPVARAGSTNTISPAGISFDATISLWDKIYHGYAEYFNRTIKRLSYFILQSYSCYLHKPHLCSYNANCFVFLSKAGPKLTFDILNGDGGIWEQSTILGN